MFFQDLHLGMQVETDPVTITEEEMLSFAKRYADIPLHTDPEYAKTTRFGKLLAPGMLTFLTVWAEYLRQDFFGSELIAGISQEMDWKKPVFAGDILTATFTITLLIETGSDKGIAELEMLVCNQHNQTVMTGHTQCFVRKHPYRFYGWENVIGLQSERMPGITSPQMLYDMLCRLWTAETCAPRLRDQWTPENPTLGQCSITAFLVQDLFGGRVYGIPRPGGNFHCYNVVDGVVFDLTSEQFGDEVLDYTDNPEQSRETHFAKQEKYERYLHLKAALESCLKGENG